MSTWEEVVGSVRPSRAVPALALLMSLCVVLTQAKPAGAAEAEPAKAEAEVPSAEDTRYVDAHCDHVLWASTAETHPKGTWFFTDYELIIPHAGYAVSDRFEVMLTWLFISWADVAVKANVYRGSLLRSAVIGGFDIPTRQPEPQPMGRLGGVQQLCFSSVCWSSISLNGFVNWDASGSYPASHTNLIVMVGGVFALGRTVKLLLEPHWFFELEGSSSSEFGLGGGVRFSGRHLGLDLGIVPVNNEGYTYPLPWLAFTYRTSGERPEK